MHLNCVSINNQKCKVRPEIVDVSNNNPIFYPFSVKINRCSGNCNSINDPYAKICVPDIVKILNVKEFNLMSRTNETKLMKLHETCKCICRLNKVICNKKQRWNKDQCRSECKELVDKGLCDKGYIFNARNCKCECDKSCNTSQYLYYLENSCKVYIALTIIAIVISAVFSIYFVYYNWFLIKKKDFCTKYNTRKETIKGVNKRNKY